MDSKRCPFCGSEKIRVATPYIDKFGDKIFSFCCLSQKRNNTFAEKRFGKDNKPSPEEVAKW